MTYDEFLAAKIDIAEDSGIEVDAAEINPALKPHQRDAVLWALKGGRRALFESFGLGKTIQQLEWARLIHAHTGARVLIILPLGVKQEFQLDAVRVLGWKDAPPYVRTDAEALVCATPVVLTNYERVRDGDLNPRRFGAVSLDEASCLRSFGSKTYQQFLTILKGIPYKLVCTATPSPNRYKELIHYAGYLEIMDTGQALTRFFQRDSTKANNLTLYPHRERDFWLWMSSWALFIEKPSDLGYDDTGYDLPEMEVRWHCLPVDNATAGTDKHGQVKMLRDAAFSLQDAAREGLRQVVLLHHGKRVKRRVVLRSDDVRDLAFRRKVAALPAHEPHHHAVAHTRALRIRHGELLPVGGVERLDAREAPHGGDGPHDRARRALVDADQHALVAGAFQLDGDRVVRKRGAEVALLDPHGLVRLRVHQIPRAVARHAQPPRHRAGLARRLPPPQLLFSPVHVSIPSVPESIRRTTWRTRADPASTARGATRPSCP